MFDFIVGYVLGAHNSGARRLSGKAIGILLLALVAICGIGWLVVGAMQSDNDVGQCGGSAMATAACTLAASATKLGVLLLGIVAVVVVVWTAIVMSRKES